MATKAVVIPNPKPLLDRSNVHHRPKDKAARVSESCTLLSKLSFCVTRLLRQSLKLEPRQIMIKYLLDKISLWNVVASTGDTVRLPSCHGTEGSWTDLSVGIVKGYNTGVVDADKHCDTSHDAGPLPLKFVWFSQVAIQAGVQKAHHGWERRTKIRSKYHLHQRQLQGFSVTNTQTEDDRKEKTLVSISVKHSKLVGLTHVLFYY